MKFIFEQSECNESHCTAVIIISCYNEINFSTNIILYLYETLKKDGYEDMAGRIITDKIEIIDVCKTNDRGILGSMNDMIAHSKFYFTDYKMTPSEMSRRLNEMPYSYLKYKNPLEVIKEISLS